ncbi:MAG: NTP transferase domain-containing protein [Candidatus Latescibacteria bacterium]|nr:NTP transferase domain-containing protein [Candidatus Latescibacterota bacterium]
MVIRKAVVLAAGRGQRLHPYTLLTPKPMLRLAGRPLLEHLLLRLVALGLKEALIVTGYLEEEIRAYFGVGSTLGLALHYHRQAGEPGTGAALQAGREFAGEAPFLSTWGDALFAAEDGQRLLATYAKRPCHGILLLERTDDPHQGAAVYLEGDRIVRLVEKPPPGTSSSPWNQSGVAVYTPAIFTALDQVPLSVRGERELTAGVQALAAAGPVYGVQMQHPRIHLTTPADLPAAETALRPAPAL